MHVLVQLIGLCLITKFSENPIAILPAFASPTSLPHNGGMLEPHTAVIVFPKAAYKSSKHWTLHDLDANNDYVKVRHALLTFSGSGGTPTIPPYLPHLQTACCPQMRGINPDYLPDNGFPQAQGIVQIDHGTLAAVTNGYNAALTEWTIDLPANETTITITANGYQELTLDAPTIVQIDDRPFKAITNAAGYTKPMGQHDFEAYYLLGVGSDVCSKYPGDDIPDDCEPGGGSSPLRRPKWLPRKQWRVMSSIPKTVDSECSNSQYP